MHTQGGYHVDLKVEIRMMYLQGMPKIVSKPPDINREMCD